MRWTPRHGAALASTLASPATPGAQITNVTVNNYLPFTVYVSFLNSSGYQEYLGKILSTQSASIANAFVGDIFVVSAPMSGAFICLITLAAATTQYNVTNELLLEPNAIGDYPQPTKNSKIPQNSPLVLVGCGTVPPTLPVSPTKLPLGPNPPTWKKPEAVVAREQYWRLQGDSYSVAPGETLTSNYTITTGKERLSSAEATVGTSVGASAGGGWGPVSAGLSVSLNASASVFQQVTVSEETTTYVGNQVVNTTSDARMVLRWQLMDIITVYVSQGSDGDYKAASSITSGSAVLVQAYTPSDLATETPRAASVERPRPSLTAPEHDEVKS